EAGRPRRFRAALPHAPHARALRRALHVPIGAARARRRAALHGARLRSRGGARALPRLPVGRRARGLEAGHESPVERALPHDREVRRRKIRRRASASRPGEGLEAAEGRLMAGIKRSHKEDKLAKIYDTDVLPIWSRRFGRLLLRDLALPPKAMVLDVGCGTGYPSLEILGKMDAEGRIIAIDPSSPMLDEARNKAGRLAGKRIFFRSESATPRLVFADDVYDLVLCNAGLHEFDDPERAVREFARVAKPGGRVAVTLPLAGTFNEFFDLYREVLGKLDRQDAIDRLDAHMTQYPPLEQVEAWFEDAGLVDVSGEWDTFTLLFKSSREFFFAPLIEYGPLGEWKAIAGKGQPMQDAFWHLKEAIDAYYAGRPFAVTVNAGIVRGRKEQTPAEGRLILDREPGDAEADKTGEVELITGDFDIVGEQKKLEELDGVDDDEPEEPIL